MHYSKLITDYFVDKYVNENFSVNRSPVKRGLKKGRKFVSEGKKPNISSKFTKEFEKIFSKELEFGSEGGEDYTWFKSYDDIDNWCITTTMFPKGSADARVNLYEKLEAFGIKYTGIYVGVSMEYTCKSGVVSYSGEKGFSDDLADYNSNRFKISEYIRAYTKPAIEKFSGGAEAFNSPTIKAAIKNIESVYGKISITKLNNTAVCNAVKALIQRH